jgi:hypothetical protein
MSKLLEKLKSFLSHTCAGSDQTQKRKFELVLIQSLENLRLQLLNITIPLMIELGQGSVVEL